MADAIDVSIEEQLKITFADSPSASPSASSGSPIMDMDKIAKLVKDSEERSAQLFSQLSEMFNSTTTRQENQNKALTAQLLEVKDKLDDVKDSKNEKSFNSNDTPPDHSREGRRSSFFIPNHRESLVTPPRAKDPSAAESVSRSQEKAVAGITVVQTEIIYNADTRLKFISTTNPFESLIYLTNLMIKYRSQYEDRVIKTSRLLSPGKLIDSIVSKYNNYLQRQSVYTRAKYLPISSEEFLSLSNAKVIEVFVEAIRPASAKEYSTFLVNYLQSQMPQKPPCTMDTFSEFFYTPLTKSLNDLSRIHAVFSQESGLLAQDQINQGKRPDEGYGKKYKEGELQLWLISLGVQQFAVENILGGRDSLKAYNNLDKGITFIEETLCALNIECEETKQTRERFTRPDFSHLVRSPAGESHNRNPHLGSRLPQSQFPHNSSQHTSQYSKLSALDSSSPYHNEDSDTTMQQQAHQDDGRDTELHYQELRRARISELEQEPFREDPDPSSHPVAHEQSDRDHAEEDNDEFGALSPGQQSQYKFSLRNILQDYCSIKLQHGACNIENCKYSHGARELALCQESLTLLAKGDLSEHHRKFSSSGNSSLRILQRPDSHVVFHPDPTPPVSQRNNFNRNTTDPRNGQTHRPSASH
jgi:hypothetical protein